MAVGKNQSPKPFQLIAGDVALDLINTLDDRFSETGPEELLASYDDLLRFVTESGLLTERQARKLRSSEASQSERAPVLTQVKVLAQVKELREAAAEVVYARLDGKEISSASLELLEVHFKQAASHRYLTTEPAQLAWNWRGLGRQAAAPWWLLAQSTADLLLSEDASRIRSCASDTCRWLFLDTSKNHTRRWCDMKVCGNRMKARRFHARQTG
jgi:predicted RNA-binding Zn ribbon-like protein